MSESVSTAVCLRALLSLLTAAAGCSAEPSSASGTLPDSGGAAGTTTAVAPVAGGNAAVPPTSVPASGGGAAGTLDEGTAGMTVVGGAGGAKSTTGAAGMDGVAGTGGAPSLPELEDFTKYHDPGVGPWELGTPEQCRMDPSLFDDAGIATYAVFRYGRLCHMKGSDSVGRMFSATKTLAAVAAGRAAYLARDVAKTEPGTGPMLPEDLGTDWVAIPTYPNADATLSHIMAMVAAASPSLDDSALVWRYDTNGSEAISTMIQATERCAAQVSGVPVDMAAFVQQELFDRIGMSSSSYDTPFGIASAWSANLSDMGKLGTLLVHDGWYGGERLVSREWVYRMSHPSFESANTSYGQLTWVNHRGNAKGVGGNISSGANAPQGDPCAPAAFWPSYPHGLSKAADCRAEVGSCKQLFDVGVFSAQGLRGQYVVMHPGLDLVIVAQNFSDGDGPMGLWNAIRPGVVAMDPTFADDEAAFCAAYGAGNYAPDLLVPRRP